MKRENRKYQKSMARVANRKSLCNNSPMVEDINNRSKKSSLVISAGAFNNIMTNEHPNQI